MMSIEERIRRCRIIEKMQKHESYCKKIGLVNISRFHGNIIYDKEDRIC